MKNIINSLLGRYKSHDEAIVLSVYFNPQRSKYRLKAFKKFYSTIQHLNHRILEIVIADSEPELPLNENITRIFNPSLLWHKESGLNLLIAGLPEKYKYVFWVDADVLFTNHSWLTESVKVLQNGANILQPFSYCVHLNKDEVQPTEIMRLSAHNPADINTWNSFCYTYNQYKIAAASTNYDFHGHVGFAWGAKRELLDSVPLYDRALIGGADHIIAHAAAGHIPHKCITKSFSDDIDAVNAWSKKFYSVIQGKIGHVRGGLYHLWHGDIKKRNYLKRIQDFTPAAKTIEEKDENGLYINKDPKKDRYIKDYFNNREVTTDDGFLQSVLMGYTTNNAFVGPNIMGSMVGEALNTSENESNTSVLEAPANESTECTCDNFS
jgi:hypothetical protein